MIALVKCYSQCTFYNVYIFGCCFFIHLGVDPDGGRVHYSISGPIFSVDSNTGVVTLRQQLDRETQDTIEVIISITGKQ